MLVKHPHTDQQLKDFINNPSHALLLSGPAGSGKRSLAEELGEQLLEITRPFSQYAYAKISAPVEGKGVSIEQIRELETFISLKVPSATTINRVIIIDEAHTMKHEAQNALLKTLEEPPQGTVIILLASHVQALLPTIRSRVQSIAVKSPSLEALQTYFGNQGVKRAYTITGGLPGLMYAMLHNQDHPMLTATEKARLLLGQSTYERLTQVDALSKDKVFVSDILFILQQMAHISLQTAQGKAADKWQKVLSVSYEAYEQLENNAQTKLVLTKLMLSL